MEHTLTVYAPGSKIEIGPEEAPISATQGHNLPRGRLVSSRNAQWWRLGESPRWQANR